MNKQVTQLAREYKSALTAMYGEELAELVLFGSYARGDAHGESDLDFAVVLRHSFQSGIERLKTVPISSQLSLKYGLMVSTLFVSLDKKQHSFQGVYKDIRSEGVSI